MDLILTKLAHVSFVFGLNIQSKIRFSWKVSRGSMGPSCHVAGARDDAGVLRNGMAPRSTTRVVSNPKNHQPGVFLLSGNKAWGRSHIPYLPHRRVTRHGRGSAHREKSTTHMFFLWFCRRTHHRFGGSPKRTGTPRKGSGENHGPCVVVFLPRTPRLYPAMQMEFITLILIAALVATLRTDPYVSKARRCP